MPTPPTRPALRERYDRRQQEVVATAAALFARNGFQATTMDELSEATGLGAGGLYHYIGSKQRLLFGIFEQLMDPLLERAAQIEASEDPDRLRTLVRAWVAHIERHLDHMAVFAQERHAIERAPEWEQVRASRDAFEAILARLLTQAGVEDRITLFALLGMVNHTATWLRPGGRMSAEQIADGYISLVTARLNCAYTSSGEPDPSMYTSNPRPV